MRSYGRCMRTRVGSCGCPLVIKERPLSLGRDRCYEEEVIADERLSLRRGRRRSLIAKERLSLPLRH